ncbi:MAG TPA: serine/threonine-protein kinase [Polyangiaceae bacterium]|nr:serine/threonine-protein kinase [Polyangiaceae bacterium]
MTGGMPGPSTLKSPLAQEIPSGDDPRVGSVLADRYRIDALLGEGGMGRVYAAEHVLMRKRLAVKVLHRELTTVPEVVQRFEREAMAAANIDHPNVAAATDFGKLADGAVFLVLEYVQGKNLRDEIAAGPLGVERALHITRQIASALASAHALEIVHRDLKPENVMLVEKSGDGDFAKVLDFGIARVPIGEVSGTGRSSSPITKVGMVFGTPEYMAPEQALGQPVDGRADLYALGVIAYEMVSGVRPFSSKSPVGILGQQLSKPPPPFAERAPGVLVSPSVEQVIMRLLAKDASDRYQTAVELVEALDALLGAPLTRGGRRFTQLSGSPNSVRGSNPNLRRAELNSSAQIHNYSPLSEPRPESGRFPSSAEPPRVEAGQTARLEPLAPVSAGRWDTDTAQLPGSYPEPLADGESSLEPVTRSPLGERLLDWVDERRTGLPRPVKSALRDVPAVGLLAGAAVTAALVVGAFILVVVALTGSHAPVPAARASAPPPSAGPAIDPAPPAAKPPAAELDAARQQGVEALEALSTRYPKDSAVLLELVGAYDTRGDHAQSVGAIGRALSLDPKLMDNAQVATGLFKAAQAKASADASFALLEGPMGSRGADIVYDLATTKGVRQNVKTRALGWLKTKEFDRASSAALNIAVALRQAQSCQQKHALLLRAKNVGDERSLPELRLLEARTGCGRRKRDDCFACLRKDDRLKQAITTIQARTG